MMPSRGFQLAKRHILSQAVHQSRKLSSAARPGLRSRCAGHKSSSLWPRTTPNITSAIVAVRYASTTPASPAAQTPSNDSTLFPNLDTITLDNFDLKSTSDLANIPEQIGYLSELGVNYGIGVTSGIQWLMEHIHIYSGLPWWASIAATGITLRLITIPLYLRSSDNMARQNALVSITKPITDRMTQAQKAGNSTETMQALAQLRAVRKRAGISFVTQLTPMAIQTVLGFCGFRLMQKLCSIPVPGFRDGGFLWLSDLTLTDGYLLMPLIMAGTIHVLIRLGGESGNSPQPMAPGMQAVMLYFMPAFMFLILSFQPGAVCVWFAASGAVGITQSLVLRNPAVRRTLGLAPLYQPTKQEAGTGALAAFTGYGSDAASTSSASKSPTTHPTYQAPTINTRSNQTIDTKLVNKHPNNMSATTSSRRTGPAEANEAQGPSTSSQPGIFRRASDAWTTMKRNAKEKAVAQNAEAAEKAWKRRVDAYEKAAQQKRR